MTFPLIFDENEIVHRPFYADVVKAEKLYSKKEGVPVKYVLTSSLDARGIAVDIYFRETPHPQFGNRYFGLFRTNGTIAICDADPIEGLFIDTIKADAGWIYSTNVLDMVTMVHDGEGVSIDGGRDYRRILAKDFSNIINRKFKVKDGNLIHIKEVD